MNNISVKLFATVIVSICVSGLLSACQSRQQAEYVQHAVVYSAKPVGAQNRAIYLSDEIGNSYIKITDFNGNAGYPSVSPDGKRLAFYGKYDSNKTWSIHTVNIDGSNMQRLTATQYVWDSAPSWSADGKLIAFAREYNSPENGWQEEIWLMDADGSNQRQVKALQGRAPYFLPDGRILFHTKTGPSQIAIANTDGSNVIQLTNNSANDWSPKMSPDGSKILFVSDRDGNREIYSMNNDGSAQTRITFNEVSDWDPAWSGDGSKIFFATENGEGALDIYKANVDGSGMEKFKQNALQLSPVSRLHNSALTRLIQAR